jgi:hypothetical protein
MPSSAIEASIVLSSMFLWLMRVNIQSACTLNTLYYFIASKPSYNILSVLSEHTCSVAKECLLVGSKFPISSLRVHVWQTVGQVNCCCSSPVELFWFPSLGEAHRRTNLGVVQIWMTVCKVSSPLFYTKHLSRSKLSHLMYDLALVAVAGAACDVDHYKRSTHFIRH